jgi:hypothetical protein
LDAAEIKKTNDNVFEALFRQAVVENFLDELDSLPPDDELAKLYPFSPEHEARMKKLLNREMRKERFRNVATHVRKIAAALAIIVAVLFGSLMLVPEVRAAVIDTIISWHEMFVRFVSNAPAATETGREPRHIPRGFQEEYRIEDEEITTILYTNDYGEVIVFESGPIVGSLALDNANATHVAVYINGMAYHVFTAIYESGENFIVWEIGGMRYFVRSTIAVSELQLMAESVR